MKRKTITILVAAAFVLWAPARLVADDMDPLQFGLPAEKFDFTGEWLYQTMGHQVSGACPERRANER